MDIVHKADKFNWDVDGLSPNPSPNEKDIIGVHYHGDVNLEIILRWYAFAYLCTLFWCFRDTLQIDMNTMDSYGVKIKVMIPQIYMMMHLQLHICKHVKFRLD